MKRKLRIIGIFIRYRCLFLAIILYTLKKLGFIEKRVVVEALRRKKERILSRKYKKLINSFSSFCDEEYEKIIWVCWLQGEEDAPPIVKKCIQSIRANSNGWSVILIDKNNLNQYANIDSILMEKWEKGIITNTHFSDIIRCQLLIEHGGIWMDATCYMTHPLPSYVYEREFFTFKNELRNEKTTKLSSWFIFSHKNNSLFVNTMQLELKYWKKRKNLDEYFLFHLFFSIVTNKENTKWERVYPYCDLVPHLLASQLSKKYEKEIFDNIISQCFVHKLTYKFDVKPSEDSFFEYILKR